MWSGNKQHAKEAEAEGLTVRRTDFSEDSVASFDLDGIDYALAVGDDDGINAMMASDLSEYFGHDRLFQLAVSDDRTAPLYERAATLFDNSASHVKLATQLAGGGRIIAVPVPSATTGEASMDIGLGQDGVPMFVHTPGKELCVVVSGDRPELRSGQELIGLTTS
jgi:hypothetical protein